MSIRWTSTRKLEVVQGVRRGDLSIVEACERYNLSLEEFLTWEKRASRGKNHNNLKATVKTSRIISLTEGTYDARTQ